MLWLYVARQYPVRVFQMRNASLMKAFSSSSVQKLASNRSLTRPRSVSRLTTVYETVGMVTLGATAGKRLCGEGLGKIRTYAGPGMTGKVVTAIMELQW